MSMQTDTLKNNILDKIKMEFQKMFVPHRKAEIGMYYSLDGPQGIMLNEKPHLKSHILYDTIYIKFSQ